jgi:pimeloyl-ACP methyl ester carboxylesterase
MSVSDKTIQVNALNVHYWEAGEGNTRTLLLIHGGIGDAKLHWEAALPILGETFHVLAPDLPGFGGSELLPVMQTDVLLHWLKSFLATKAVEQAVVVGNSFGGLIARLLAAANPKQAPAVILVNGGGIPTMPGLLKVAQKIPGLSNVLFSFFGTMATGKRTLKGLVANKTLLTDTFYADSRKAAAGFANLMQMLVSSGLPDAQVPLVPTLIMWGVEDGFAPLKEGEKIKASIPGSTLTQIADCGHMPQLEAPDVFAWQVTTFLDDLTRPKTSKPGGPKALRNPSG